MYKLTNQNLETYNGFKWEIGKWYRIPDEYRGKGLCSESWFHCYSNPLLAVFFNPTHANIKNPRLFEVNVKDKKLSNDGTKYGYTMMKLKRELPVPEIALTQRVAFAILCAKQVHKDKKWNEWADNWLSGKDRTRLTAHTAENAAEKAAAYADAVYAAGGAARAAENVAYAAEKAAEKAAARAAYTAAFAAGGDINLIKLIKQAMKGD